MSLPYAVFDHVEGEDPDEIPNYYASWGSACSDVAARVKKLCSDGYTVLGRNQNLESDLVVRLAWRNSGGDLGHIVHIVPTRLVSTWYEQYATDLGRALAREESS